MIKVRTFNGDCFELEPVPGQTAAQLVYLSGLFEAPALCNGIGRCGRCRMRFSREGDTLKFGSGAGLRPEQGVAPEADELDLQTLGPKAVAQGWRLGCHHAAEAGQTLELPPEIRSLRKRSRNRHGLFDSGNSPDSLENTGDLLAVGSEIFRLKPKLPTTGTLALDFGSTSLHALWLSGSAPEHESHAMVAPNPQMGAGSDIMSRLAWAAEPAGREQLSHLSLDATRRLLNEAPAQSREVVLAANPAMVYLLLGKDAAGLAQAPYRLDYRGGQYENLPGLPPFWVSPLISPFIGGDISAGFSFLALNKAFKPEYPFVLADLGTNGELLLALDRHTALAASLPLGPALEGGGMRHGAEARPENGPATGDEEATLAQTAGIITSFSLSPHGLTAVTLPPDTLPQGISGTGYISLAHNLRKLNLLNSEGHFVRPEPAQVSPPAFMSQGTSFAPAFPRSGPLAAELTNSPLGPLSSHLPGPLFQLARRLGDNLQRLPNGEPYWPVFGKIGMSAGDVEELLKVKAAFSLGLKLLLKKAGIPPRPAGSHMPGQPGKSYNGLAAIYLAGSLGRHIENAALTGLGFVPENLGGRIRPVGNTSLAGAALLAGSPQKQPLREELCRWAEGVETLNLAAEPEFHQMFAAEMFFK
ncbi:MAG: ASKHA domain-containing protein [Deltaproteobacteria bacterium]|nr:ASKHA domain-containing protein [Deltaproteobacteria bacterium]